jgi:hypothetical protein
MVGEPHYKPNLTLRGLASLAVKIKTVISVSW